MKAYLKKLGYLALVFACFVAVLGSTGCASDGRLARPGWIVPNR